MCQIDVSDKSKVAQNLIPNKFDFTHCIEVLVSTHARKVAFRDALCKSKLNHLEVIN